MSTDITQFDPLDPDEIVPLTFEFDDLVGSIAENGNSPLVAITRHSGTADDRNLATSMLVGAPQVIGLSVRQKVTAPVHGTTYKVRCRVDTAEGYRYAEAVLLPGETK